jgi:tetratricopeptide (TPR) repeat protein
MAFPTLAYRGLTYVHLGLYDKALEDYLDIVEALETSAGLNLDKDCMYFNMGWLHAHLNSNEKASSAFSKVDSSSHLAPDAMSWLSSIRKGSGNAKKHESLPGFCTTVFPPGAGVIAGNQTDSDNQF